MLLYFIKKKVFSPGTDLLTVLIEKLGHLLKILTRGTIWLYNVVTRLNEADGMTNSVDPDQQSV